MKREPSQAVKDLAATMDGVEIGEEDHRIPANAKELSLVVVYGASDDLVEFRGAIRDEIGCYEGGTFYIAGGGVFDEDDFCGCKWGTEAKKTALAQALTIDALWCEVDGYSWTFSTDIPHAGFDVMEDGETYCRGIVFDLGALAQPGGAA